MLVTFAIHFLQAKATHRAGGMQSQVLARVAAGYRFIQGLKGTGNTTSPQERWQNLSSTSHNEYYGATGGINDYPPYSCESCHTEGEGWAEYSPFRTYDSTIKVPNQSMSGFCSTCHGIFHSSAAPAGDLVANSDGTSGAFLRHPSDYVIPDKGEYAAYTEYDITAPVARTDVRTNASSIVEPGKDLVMCLSCHQAHATPYDGMLRFDYQAIVAGDTAIRVGCLACHSTKGIAPENRE